MKGHSERVPGKNVRGLGGVPLFHWIMRALRESRHIGDIVVNTDSEEIARDAERSFGAKILMRPPELCGDMVPIQPLIAHDLAHTTGDLYLQTHSTNPFVRSATIDAAVDALLESRENDSLFTVTPMQTRFYWPDGRPVNHDPEVLLRTQDLPPILEENSCIYIFSRAVFEQRGHRLGARPLLFPMEPLESVDIDEEHDFLVAEALVRAGVVDEAPVPAGAAR
jgi:CMP-N-acetylneuraminic acid synthetase